MSELKSRSELEEVEVEVEVERDIQEQEPKERIIPDDNIRTEARDANPDPITDEPGAHPVGVAAGGVVGAATGAAIGTAVGGPVGTIVGGAIGAVVGGAGGKGVAEVVDPTGVEPSEETKKR